MTNPIEAQWLEIETEHYSLCSDEFRELQRGTFFAGAMAAMQAVAGWSPQKPGVFTIDSLGMAAVADELTASFNEEQAAADKAEAHEMVHH